MRLVILLWILPVTFGDIYVTCIYSAECMLPCTSTNLDIIHWYKDTKQVHSFYYNQDQLSHQSEDYKGRTSLLPQSEIKNGNVSLLLKNIRVQDEGRYKCYTANEKTNDEKFVSVSVEAPVKSVDITLKNETVTCNTSGVYPQPEVSWSSEPLANQSLNTFQQTEEKLFMVTSELKVGFINSTYKYTCSITIKNRTRTATLEKPGSGTVNNLTGSATTGMVAGIIVAIVIAIVVIAIFFVMKRKKKCSSEGTSPPASNSETEPETEPLKHDISSSQ